MRARQRGSIENIRMLNLSEACVYLGRGETNTRKYCDEIHATRKVGKRVMFDRNVIDSALDSLIVGKES